MNLMRCLALIGLGVLVMNQTATTANSAKPTDRAKAEEQAKPLDVDKLVSLVRVWMHR